MLEYLVINNIPAIFIIFSIICFVVAGFTYLGTNDAYWSNREEDIKRKTEIYNNIVKPLVIAGLVLFVLFAFLPNKDYLNRIKYGGDSKLEVVENKYGEEIKQLANHYAEEAINELKKTTTISISKEEEWNGICKHYIRKLQDWIKRER